MTGNAASHALNPQEVINASLLDFLIGQPYIETSSRSALKDVFEGPMTEWSSFNAEMNEWYFSQELQSAFTLTAAVDLDDDPAVKRASYKNHASLGHVEVSDEITLSARFTNNVLDRVVAVAKALTDPGIESTQGSVTPCRLLPENFKCGSAKMVRRKDRVGVEPDVVFKILGSKDEQKIKMIGELKFCVTCDIEEAWENESSMGTGSMRHIFGQVARDMQKFGVRFGFVSTYEQTIFLKISRQTQNGRPGKYGLYYSRIVKHTDSTKEDTATGIISSISLRLGLLFLLSRPSRDDKVFDTD